MLISKTLESLINSAVHAELYASNLYKHLANQMQRLGYFGAQKFFIGESGDELKHYQIHVNFLNDMGTVAKVPAIEAMTDAISSLRDALELAYDTEEGLAKEYASWFKQASDDPLTAQHLLQFLEIQRKSVGEYADLIARMDRAKDNEAAILMIDQELGA